LKHHTCKSEEYIKQNFFAWNAIATKHKYVVSDSTGFFVAVWISACPYGSFACQHQQQFQFQHWLPEWNSQHQSEQQHGTWTCWRTAVKNESVYTWPEPKHHR